MHNNTHHFPTDQDSLSGGLNILFNQSSLSRLVRLIKQFLNLHNSQFTLRIPKELTGYLVSYKYLRRGCINGEQGLVGIAYGRGIEEGVVLIGGGEVGGGV